MKSTKTQTKGYSIDLIDDIGGGVEFWVYISPQNETSKFLTEWKVVIEHEDTKWIGVINSDNPKEILKTPSLYGYFKLSVFASGRYFEWQRLEVKKGSKKNIACAPNSVSMITLECTEDKDDANYYTIWNALFNQLK